MPEDHSKRQVVITGYGMITPLGRNTEETFHNASQGVSGIDYIHSFATTDLPCRIGGQVNDLWLQEAEDEGDRGLNVYLSRTLGLMICATREAAKQAKLHEIEDRYRIGMSLGTHGEPPSVEAMMRIHRFYDGKGGWDIERMKGEGGYPFSNFFLRKPDTATSLLSMVFDCRGRTNTMVSACSAGAQAIGESYRTIREGKCDVMIAGGCDATLTLMGLLGFVLLNALSVRHKTPQTASRPFDRKRNGFVMSEGACAVVLEELEHARSRGAPVLGEVLGYGDSADAYRMTDMHPEGEGAVAAMEKAMDDASIGPGDIDYINAHGTSTLQNDLAETRAIKAAFGERAKKIPVSSNKSMLGHTLGAAGAIEFILTLVGMNRSIILPTINYEYPDPKCDLDYVPNKSRMVHHARALSNSFGFGGQNSCLCIGKYEG